MITIRLIRGAGDRPAADISEPLIAGSEAAAIARANAELDARGSQRERVSLEIEPQAGLAPGQIVEVREIGREPWRGMIDSIRMEIAASPQGGAMTLKRSFVLEIEREEA